MFFYDTGSYAGKSIQENLFSSIERDKGIPVVPYLARWTDPNSLMTLSVN